MRNILLKSAAIISTLLLFFGLSMAQSEDVGKMKIQIKTDVNGEKNEFTKEFDVSNLENISEKEFEKIVNEFKEFKADHIDLSDEDIDIDIDIDFDDLNMEKIQEMFLGISIDDEEEEEIKVMSRSSGSGFLGLYTESYQPKEGPSKGILVHQVINESGAKEAGLMIGDVITKINGNEVNSHGDLVHFMQSTKPGDKVKVEYLHQGKKNKVEIELGEHIIRSCTDNRVIKKKEIIKDRETHNVEKTIIWSSDGDIEIDEENMEMTIINEDGFEKVIDLEEIIEKYGNEGKNEVKVKKMVIVKLEVEDAEADEVNKILKRGNRVEEINNDLQLENFEFYPNPNDGKFNVSFNVPTEAETSLEIIDSNGKGVMQIELGNFTGSFNERLDLQDASPGNYIMLLRHGDKSLTKKIIIGE